MVQIWYGVGKCKYNLVQKNIISELILMKINFLLIHRQDLVRKPYPWSKLQNGHNDNFGKILVKKSIFLIIVKICVRYRDILVDVQAKLGLKTNQQAPLPIMQTVASYSRALQRLAERLLREKKVFFLRVQPLRRLQESDVLNHHHLLSMTLKSTTSQRLVPSPPFRASCHRMFGWIVRALGCMTQRRRMREGLGGLVEL